RRLAGQLAGSGPVDAVIVLTDTGVGKGRVSLLSRGSTTTVRTGLRLQRARGESVRLESESGGAGRSAGAGSQLARLAFPLGIGDQAALLDASFQQPRPSRR